MPIHSRSSITVPASDGPGAARIPEEDWNRMVEQADIDDNNRLDAVEYWLIDQEIRRVIAEEGSNFAEATVRDIADEAPLEIVVLLPMYQKMVTDLSLSLVFSLLLFPHSLPLPLTPADSCRRPGERR